MIKNSIIYYSSARGFDLPSRPHFLMLRGFTGFFKGDSRCTVSSLIHQPSLSTYRQTHPYSVCLCTAKYTNTLILWLKQLAALTEMKYNIHISPSEGKTFSFFLFFSVLLTLLSPFSLHFLLHLLAGSLCHLLFRFRCSSSISRYLTSVPCCSSSNQRRKQLCALSGCNNINLGGDNSQASTRGGNEPN